MSYNDKLEAAKEFYPFEEWEKQSHPDPDDPDSPVKTQHNLVNCKKAEKIFDTLISDLVAIGSQANDEAKIPYFKVAVLALNKLNNEIDNFILTGEREDLCKLIDQITLAALTNPEVYIDGDCIADQWREW